MCSDVHPLNSLYEIVIRVEGEELGRPTFPRRVIRNLGWTVKAAKRCSRRASFSSMKLTLRHGRLWV
jgi:hypothetical protein